MLSATGRECEEAPSSRAPWDDRRRCTDITRPRSYVERYEYDAAGNMLQLRHRSGSNGFTRRFTVLPGTNRLAAFATGQDRFPLSYDGNGNLVQETTSRHFEWDYGDRMKAFRVQNGESEPSVDVRYHYDAGRQRVKKVIRRPGGVVDSIVYIDGLFEHHRWKRSAGSGENNHVHVSDAMTERVPRSR